MCWNEFKKNPYKWLWTRIGGRPWTYIIRDLWHKFELFWIISLICLGVYLGHHYDWMEVTRLIVVFGIGYLFGHLFWGTEYKENQQGE
jgi:hypothetical protein